MIKACIFDLDGVLVDTAKYHFLSWKKLADMLRFKIEDGLEEKLKGISRMDSLEIVLDSAGIKASDSEKFEFAKLKNEWYLESIAQMKRHETLPNVVPTIQALLDRGYKVAVGSASKNAVTILDKIELLPYFDIVVDGNMVKNSKPDPEVFLTAASSMGYQAVECIVFEDAEKGIDAALVGGFRVVGVGDPANLQHAEIVIPGFQNVDIHSLITDIEKRNLT
jgi:beta-phosphoglucomutase